jgi:hypothetical protein
MTLIDDADAVALTLAYEAEIDRLALAVGRAVRDAFLDLVHLNEADIEEFVRNAKPYTSAGIREASDLAAGYIAELTGEVVVAGTVDPRVYFDTPFHKTWHRLSEGDLWADARQSGASAADGVGYDSVSDGASAGMGKAVKSATGWRRMLQPGACEWCQVVATKLYRTQESATFGHLKCHCKPVPVLRANDPTAAINKARLAELKANGATKRAGEISKRARARRRALTEGEMP